MKFTTLLPFLVAVVFSVGCKPAPAKDPSTPGAEIPEALKDEKSSSGFLTKSNLRGSMMDNIYDDLTKKDPALQKLEEQLQHFNAGFPDSLKKFNEYANKSTAYYSSANESLNMLKDTVLRNQLRALLADSKSKYMGKISRFSNLMAHIDSNRIKIEDYHTVLKVVTTLPVIEKYQDNTMPDITSTANLANEAQRLRAKTYQLVKKQEKN
jgi:hypothetical protein